ncbi:DnaD domain protein [Metasolibacillus fluoroglycofenilyticus]|uniref:DnaD domain protein n=1 Tax=Metasolibacillus fluoroglycofenilyticus TaxID=1239396 RepID=UPI000D3DBA1C|nr:DnaD domain protein [Metasolibacillus fluoroglycofenilyticus]
MTFMNQLHPYDICEVQCPHEFNDVNQKILLACYQPIIGVEAIALYLKLSVEASNEHLTFHHHYLLDSLDFSIKRLFQARITLEAIGLLQTFCKVEDDQAHYIYRLNRPLNAKSFFADPILSISLMRKIDKKAFEHLRDTLVPKEQKLYGYTEVTRGFNDVFLNVTEKELQNIEQLYSEQRSQISTSGYTFDYNSFDFKLFFDGISQALIPHRLFTIEIKQTIAKVAFLYKFSPLDMQSIVMQSLTDEQTLTAATIEKKAADHYQLSDHHQNDYRLLKRYEITDKQKPQEEKNSREEHIHYLNKTSPIEVYEDLHGVSPTDVTVRLFNDFLNRGISYGVINTLIQYIAMSDGRLDYNVNLMQSIIDTWVRSGAKNAEDAMRISKQEHDKRSGKVVPTIQKTTHLTSAEVPDAMKDYELSTPYEFLKILTKGKEPFKNQLKTAESLMTVYGIAQGVTNVIVEHVWKQANGKLPEKFVESVAAEMQQQNIQTAEQAKRFLAQRGKAVYQIGQDSLGEFAASPQALIYDRTTPYEFLKQLYHGKEPVRFIVELAEQLVLTQKMPIGVVNYLMEYAMRETNGKLTKNYIQAIASNWMAHQLKCAADAIHLVEQEQQPVTKYKVTMDTPLAFKAKQQDLTSWLPRYDETIPYEFLKALKNGEEPLPYVVEMAENYVLSGMTVGVVNAMFEYVITQVGRINKKYVDALAANAQMQNIMLAKDALGYFQQQNHKVVTATITQDNLMQFYPTNYVFEVAEEKYEKQTPYEFIKQLNNGQEPFPYTVKAAENLITLYGMVPAVVNFLLEYVLAKTDGALPEKYINSVADSWRRQQIQTVEQARSYVKGAEQKALASKGKKVEVVPEWFNKPKEELVKEAPAEVVDIDAEYNKLLQQFRNYDGKVKSDRTD